MQTGRAEQILGAQHGGELRNPVAGGHQRLLPFHIDNARSPFRRLRNFRDCRHFRLDIVHQPRASIVNATGARQSKNIPVNIVERIGLQRDHFRPGRKASAQRTFHIGEAHRAYLTLRLRDDMRRLETFKNVVEDPVNALRRGERFLHAPVDFAAITMDIENGGGANGKLKNTGRIIAFMRASDLKVAQAERMDHFRGAGYQGDDSHSPNIALAFFGRDLFVEQFFEFLCLPFGFAQRCDIQKTDLELDFWSNVHTLLYRAQRAASIDTQYFSGLENALNDV